MKLFMLILGCRPAGRVTEQHDVFFGIGNSLADLVPSIKRFWPGAGTIHIDSWREVTTVDGYKIEIVETPSISEMKLFFINLGGYLPQDPEEHHYKVLKVAASLGEATAAAKRVPFFKHYSIKGGRSHIDDKYGFDVDEIENVQDILAAEYAKFHISVSKSDDALPEDELFIGYLPLTKIPKLH